MMFTEYIFRILSWHFKPLFTENDEKSVLMLKKYKRCVQLL